MPESYIAAVWRLVLSDIQAGLKNWWRMTIQVTAGLSATFFAVTQIAPDTLAEKVAIYSLTFLAGLIFTMLLHLLWSWVTAPRRLYYEQQEQIKSERKSAHEFEEQVFEANAKVSALQRKLELGDKQELPTDTELVVFEKSRSLAHARSMISVLINETPPTSPLNRKDVTRWGQKCLNTLREIMSSDYEEEWMKIFAKLYKAEDPKAQPASELRTRIEEIAIQLKGLYARFNHEMIRKESQMTTGEYNLLYPRDETNPPDA